jgi:hypothetical protein
MKKVIFLSVVVFLALFLVARAARRLVLGEFFSTTT